MSLQPPPDPSDAPRREVALDAGPQAADVGRDATYGVSTETGAESLPPTPIWVRVRPFFVAFVLMAAIVGGLHAWGQVAATHDDPVSVALAAARDAVLHSLPFFSPSGRAAAPVAVAEAAPPAPTEPPPPPTATAPPPTPTAAPTRAPLPGPLTPPPPLNLPPVVETPHVASLPSTAAPLPPRAPVAPAPTTAVPAAPAAPVIRPAAPPPASGVVKPAAPAFSKPVENANAWLRRAPASGAQPPTVVQPARPPVLRPAAPPTSSGSVQPAAPALSKPAENTSGWLRPVR